MIKIILSIIAIGLVFFNFVNVATTQKDSDLYLENYKDSDLVIFGEISGIEIKNLSGIEQEFYKIKITKYLKNPTPLNEIYVEKGIPLINLPIVQVNEYEVKDKILLYLIRNHNSFVTIQGSQKIEEENFNLNKIIPPPLKSSKTGIDYKKLVCRDNLVLVLKINDMLPACVKKTSVKRLEELNFATKVNSENLLETQSQILNNNKISQDVSTSLIFGAPIWQVIPGTCEKKLDVCDVTIKLVNGTDTKNLPDDLKNLGFWNGRTSKILTVDEILRFSELDIVETISSGQSLR